MHQYNPHVLTSRVKFGFISAAQASNQLSLLQTDGLENLCFCRGVTVKYGVSFLEGEIQKEIKSTLNEGQKVMQGYKNHNITKLETNMFSKLTTSIFLYCTD